MRNFLEPKHSTLCNAVNSFASQRRKDKKERIKGEEIPSKARADKKSRGLLHVRTRCPANDCQRRAKSRRRESSIVVHHRLIHVKFHSPCPSRKSKKKKEYKRKRKKDRAIYPPIQRSIIARPSLLSPKLGAFVGRKTDCSIVLDFIIIGINGRRRGRWMIPRIRGQAGRPSR